MQLDAKEAARLLLVTEKTIYRWIKQDALPVHKVSDQYRINRAELLEWATTRRIKVSPDIFQDTREGEEPLPGLEQALRSGGIHYGVRGTEKNAVLASVVDLMQLPPEVDRQFLLSVILARETLGSTGIGGGIAIPHVRNPIVLHIPSPSITLCFLEKAIEFDSLDGEPVHTLFTLVSPTVRIHLHLLSRLTFALGTEGFRGAIHSRSEPEAIFSAACAAESSVKRP